MDRALSTIAWFKKRILIILWLRNAHFGGISSWRRKIYIHSNKYSVAHAMCWPHKNQMKFSERHDFRRNVSREQRKKYGTTWIVKLKTPKHAATRRSIAFGQRAWIHKSEHRIKTNQQIQIYVYDYERHKMFSCGSGDWQKWRETSLATEKKHIFILSLAQNFISLLFRHKILMRKPQWAACSGGNVGMGTAKWTKNH